MNTWYYNEYVENVDFFDMAMRPDPVFIRITFHSVDIPVPRSYL